MGSTLANGFPSVRPESMAVGWHTGKRSIAISSFAFFQNGCFLDWVYRFAVVIPARQFFNARQMTASPITEKIKGT